MLSGQARWRLVVGLTAAIGGSFLAGCCGGPFSANDDGGGCMACADPAPSHDDCDERDASTDASSDAAAGANGR